MKSQREKYKKIEREDLVPSGVLDGARQELENRETTLVLKKKSLKKWVIAGASIVCALIVVIMTPILLLSNRKANFGSGEYKYIDLTKNEIASIEEYNKINGTKYKYFNETPSIYYEYSYKKATIILSQEILKEAKSVKLWVIGDNIVIDIFEEYKNFEKQEPIDESFFGYKVNGNETKASIVYQGWRYNLLFDGYGFEEVKELVSQLIKKA